jgi:hypothetical protein
MDILLKINQLPNEIQNIIFYFVIQTEADLIKNIDWEKEYKNTFFKQNYSYRFNGKERTNIYGYRYGKQFYTDKNIRWLNYYEKYYEKYKSTLRRVGLDNGGFSKYEDLESLRKQCIDNGITKYNKNNRISMIKKLMKL